MPRRVHRSPTTVLGMAEGEVGTSRWARLAQRRYRLPSIALLFGGWLAPKFLPVGSTARVATTLVLFPLVIGAAVVLIGPKLHRSFTATREDARADPTGRLRREAAAGKTAGDQAGAAASPDDRSPESHG